MKYGKTKLGTIHYFTDSKECLCDLNIKLAKEISKEYADFYLERKCLTCVCILAGRGVKF